MANAREPIEPSHRDSDREVWWMFKVRPGQFRDYTPSICPGILWLPGILALLAVHVGSFAPFFSRWSSEGLSLVAFLWLSPVVLVWLVLGAADIKFRLRGPNRREREGFDKAVVNWVGMVAFVSAPFILIPLWAWAIVATVFG